MIFAPPEEPQEGSLGVSFAIEDGVNATVEPGFSSDADSDITIYLDSERTAFEPVEHVLRRLDATAEVSLSSSIPVGYGFGASGAATLATALAANEACDLGRTREECVEAAHRAEVEAGTGLGDVFIQARGGLVWNVGDGIQRADCAIPIEYTAFDGIATDTVLNDDRTLEQVRNCGQDCLSRFSPDGSIREFLELSWDFAQRTGLATDRVVDEVQRIEHEGGRASMAMVGETVVATGIQDVLEEKTRITSRKATIR